MSGDQSNLGNNNFKMSCDESRFIESNDSVIALNLKIAVQYRTTRSSDRYRSRPISYTKCFNVQ